MLGEVTLPLDGQQYHLRPSRKAIAAIEEKTGRALAELAGLARGVQLTVEECGIIAAEMMRAYAATHPDCELHTDHAGANPEVCADLVFEAGVPIVQVRLAMVLLAALTGGVDASGERKPAKESRPASAG